MNFRTIEQVTLASAKTRNSASLRRQDKRVRLLALTTALMLLVFAAGLLWWAFV
jgi:hypothetical protein